MPGFIHQIDTKIGLPNNFFKDILQNYSFSFTYYQQISSGNIFLYLLAIFATNIAKT